MEQQFSKYEIARILGARALQIAMDAPLLLKLEDEDLREMNFDAIKIAEKEFEEGVLPIAISRPVPRKSKTRLTSAKEDKLSDEELIAKAQEVEKEISEEAKEMGLVNESDVEESDDSDSDEEK